MKDFLKFRAKKALQKYFLELPKLIFNLLINQFEKFKTS